MSFVLKLAVFYFIKKACGAGAEREYADEQNSRERIAGLEVPILFCCQICTVAQELSLGGALSLFVEKEM